MGSACACDCDGQPVQAQPPLVDASFCSASDQVVADMSESIAETLPKNLLPELKSCIIKALSIQGLPQAARDELDRAVSLLDQGPEGTKAHLSQLQKDGNCVPADSRAYLLANFTENFSPGEAEGAHMMAQSRSTKRRVTKLALTIPGVMIALEKVGSLDFDAAEFSRTAEVAGRPLSILGYHLIQSSGLLEELHSVGWVPERDVFGRKMSNFLRKIDELYRPDVIYHGALHGTDVMATVEWFLHLDFYRQRMSTLDHLMSLVAAAIHDVGHPGKNNLFYAKTMDSLAVRYNDRSILENMHVALAFETMQSDEECHWFKLLPQEFISTKDEPPVNLQNYMRKGLIDMVLATDMVKHAKYVTDVQALSKNSSTANSRFSKQEALDSKLFFLEILLHAADISNPCKPRELMLGWTKRILEEFWRQGDEERRLGLTISPLCDREAGRAAVPKGQVGFISFVIRPLYVPIVELIPDAQEALLHLDANKAFWEEKDNEKAMPEQLFAQVIT